MDHARIQDSQRAGVAAAPLLARGHPGVLQMASPRSSAPHLLAPSEEGETPASPLGRTGGLRGPGASSPTSTCTGGPADAAGRHGAPWSTARERPCVSHTLRRRARVEPPRAPAAPRTARPDGRTSDRTVRVRQPALFVARGFSPARRAEAMRGTSPARADHREDQPTPRPSPDVGRWTSTMPAAAGVAASSPPTPSPSRPPDVAVVAPPAPGCPVAVGGRGAPGPLPVPSEGVATLAGRDQGKWSSARARVAGSGRRRGRHGLGRPSPRGLACVAGRGVRPSPLAGTRWAGAEVRRPTAMRRLSPRDIPGDQLLPRTLRCVAFVGSHERRSESFVRPLRAAACAACPGGRAPGK